MSRQAAHAGESAQSPSASANPSGIVRDDLFVLGVPFWNAEYGEFCAWWKALMADTGKRCQTVCIANAHTLNIACTNKAYADCLRKADVRVNDGFGYRIASRLRGHHTRYNFNGTDLFPRLFAELDQPLTVFLYGAAEEANALTAERLTERYPMVRIVGRLHGYGSEEDAVDAINRCAPDLLLIALGQPKQEFFMERRRHELKVKVQAGVGGLFDFLSGGKSRAPKFVRDAGFEWLYRLLQEPRRLFRRYVIGNPVFLIRCVLDLRRDNRLTAELAKLAGDPNPR